MSTVAEAGPCVDHWHIASRAPVMGGGDRLVALISQAESNARGRLRFYTIDGVRERIDAR